MPFLVDLDRRFLRGLLLWSLVLAAGHVVFHLSWRYRNSPQLLRDIFGFASENSLASWTSIVAMFALGVACLGLGALRGQRAWKFSGLYFTYLSLDDGAMLHERIGWLSEVGDGATYAWTVVVLPFIALTGLFVFVHVWRATNNSRRARLELLLAFALWGVALVLELVEPTLKQSGVHWRGFSIHLYGQLIEEWSELIAPGVLLAAVLGMLATEVRRTPRAD